MKPIIVMPTYNEAGNAEKIINRIFDEVFKEQDISILVVDSASTDGTAEIVKSLRQKYPKLYLLEQDTKKGLASAYLEGFKRCLNEDYDVFIQMDADMQHPPEILPECLKLIEDYDLIIASRYVENGSWDKEKNIIKEMISSLGNIYVHAVLDCPFKDLTGGYNIWSRKALESIDFNKIISKGYLFQIEMKYSAYKNNMRIKEYPFTFNKRLSGKSKMDYKIVLEAFFLIWKLRMTIGK